ncbi:HAD family hydrolase [Psychrobacillus sp. OK032]|uniref:HAD family hydrolase n=1 Tax=Psychrobacillus sp. OK032 TaxID=1884358 RepID=UPI0015A5D2EF|nr:HAD family hydrolase [Psychrobacillus sp. OK032]
MMKAIIFDFDGTLANTLPICFYAFQHVFKVFDNKDLTSKEIKEMFGPSETGIIRNNLSNINKEDAIEYYYEKYSELHNDLVESNPEILDLLKSLKEKDIKIGIFTGKAKRSLDISLKALNMVGMFDVIITGDDVINPKPDPEGLLKALSIIEVKNSEAIYIGDSDADIVAGVKANVFTIGVQWLPEYQTSTFSEEPNLIIKSVKEFKSSFKVGIL